MKTISFATKAVVDPKQSKAQMYNSISWACPKITFAIALQKKIYVQERGAQRPCEKEIDSQTLERFRRKP